MMDVVESHAAHAAVESVAADRNYNCYYGDCFHWHLDSHVGALVHVVVNYVD